METSSEAVGTVPVLQFEAVSHFPSPAVPTHVTGSPYVQLPHARQTTKTESLKRFLLMELVKLMEVP